MYKSSVLSSNSKNTFNPSQPIPRDERSTKQSWFSSLVVHITTSYCPPTNSLPLGNQIFAQGCVFNAFKVSSTPYHRVNGSDIGNCFLESLECRRTTRLLHWVNYGSYEAMVANFPTCREPGIYCPVNGGYEYFMYLFFSLIGTRFLSWWYVYQCVLRM
jgi:hypothetical protein